MARVIIIGGGASGMMAALTASENTKNSVILIERQARLGRKLLSTGNGRCNLTNTGTDIRNYHGTEPSFALPALEAFPVHKTLDYFNGLGLMTVEEYGGRIYPLSNQANSVLDVLRFELEARENVEIVLGAAVESLGYSKGIFTVKYGDSIKCSERLIAACGGCAGSKLGGVMDGYRLLSGLGHSRTALHPSLTQIKTENTYPRALKGVRANAEISLWKKGRKLASKTGEILFSETGVSGTAAFELSREVSSAGEGAELRLDFFCGKGESEIAGHIAAFAGKQPSLPANSVLVGTVHNRLGQMLCKYAGISASQKASELSDGQIKTLASSCKAFILPVTGVSGFETAQVTAGGIRTSEFDHDTLQSRKVPGLYACGEVLDIDGDCGGYNLQWAWASGRLAGRLLG